jgi:hypothetical protein
MEKNEFTIKFLKQTNLSSSSTGISLVFFCFLVFSAGYDRLETKRNIQLSLKRRLTNIRYVK